MPFVVDASIVATWLMPDETHPTSEAANRRLANDVAITPALWWFEIRNMLIVNERRERIDASYTEGALGLLKGLPIRNDGQPDEDALFALARRHRLTVYDASYLELSLRHEVPLPRLDRALAAAARREGVLLVGDKN